METILLVGQPNSGKSTLFNLLSNKHRKVSNYNGVSVDAGFGEFKSNGQTQGQEDLQLVDLPGIYSLNPSSMDEAITTSTLLGLNKKIDKYSKVVMVIDVSKMETSLALALAVQDLVGDKLCLVFNKSDLLKSEYDLDVASLSEFLRTDVLLYSANKDGAQALDNFLRESLNQKNGAVTRPLEISSKGHEFLDIPWREHGLAHVKWIEDEKKAAESLVTYIAQARKILRSVQTSSVRDEVQKTQKLDKIFLHPIFGGIIFFFIFYLVFHSLYTWSAPLMDMIENLVVFSSDSIGALLPDGLIKSLIVDGIFAGVGGVVVFLPQIMILFFILNVLEQSGYIARASFIMDRLFSIFGLSGKAFLPFLSGFACSVPAIMATRNIPNKRERMATLMVLPMITCSARLPVYILLIGTFIPSVTLFGFINSQALSFFFLYFLGGIFALFMAKIFRLSFFKGQSQSFLMELPLYQKPKISLACKEAWQKGKVFLTKAGTIILFLSIVIWGLSTFPKTDASELIGKSEVEVASISLENSLMGRIGKGLEPVLKPLGYDWKMGVGILIAFGARELFVSAMGTIYALGDVDEESGSLRERLKKDKNPSTGLNTFNLAVACSLLMFFVFACQCTSTLAIVKKETGGWKWPMTMFLYMGLLAYAAAFSTYHIVSIVMT